MGKKKKRVCIVGTVYGLFLYFIISKEIDIKNTKFIISKSLSKLIDTRQLGNDIEIINTEKNIYRFSIIKILVFRLYYHFKFLGFTEKNDIYAQDHLVFASYILGNYHYSLIEDAPGCFEIYEKAKPFKKEYDSVLYQRLDTKIFHFLMGQAYNRPHGLSPTATKILMTKKYIPNYLRKKEIIFVNMKKDWDEKNQVEKNCLMKIFRVDSSFLKEIKKKKIVILTQPLCYDGFCSFEEHRRIFTLLIDHYPKDQLLIKSHPRDKYPYEKICNDILVFRSSMPSQMLDVLGIRFNKAVTVYSTAAKVFSYPIDVDFWGTGISDELIGKVGLIKGNVF